MKKILSGILILFMSSCITQAQTANKIYNSQIKAAINKYKDQNYVGCLQDLEEIAKKDPSNVIIHYYIGTSYMSVGDKGKAAEAFDKVVGLNTAPLLTSYSLQAKSCMETIGSCQYKYLSEDQITAMTKDPKAFLAQLDSAEGSAGGITTMEEQIEINKLIKGRYEGNIHPDAKKAIKHTKLIKEQEEINSTINTKLKTQMPSNDEIAEAVKTLAKIGFDPFQNKSNYTPNNQYANLGMLLGNNNNNYNQSNNYMNMLPMIMQQSKTGERQMSPEMIQTMMTSSMMPDFNFDSDKKY